MKKLVKQIAFSLLGASGLAIGVSSLLGSNNSLPDVLFRTQSNYDINNYCENGERADKFELFSLENLNNNLTKYIDTQAGNWNVPKWIKKITMDKWYGLVSFKIDSQAERMRNNLDANIAFVSDVDTEKTHPLNNNMRETYVIATTIDESESCEDINTINQFDTLYQSTRDNKLAQQRGGEFTASNMLPLNTLVKNSKLCLYFKLSSQPYGVPYGSPIDNDIFRTLTSFDYSYCPSKPETDLTITSAGYCEEWNTKIELSINNIGNATVEWYQDININWNIISAIVDTARGITINEYSANGVVCPKVGWLGWLILTKDQNWAFKLGGKGFNIGSNKSCKYLLTIIPKTNNISRNGTISMTDEINTSNNSFQGIIDLDTEANKSCNITTEDSTLTCEELISSIGIVNSNGSLLIQPILKDGWEKITNNTQLPKGYSMSCNYSVDGVNKGIVKDFSIIGALPGVYKVNCSLEFMWKKVDDCKEASYTITVPGQICWDGIIQATEQCDNGTANDDLDGRCTTACTFQCTIETKIEKPQVTIKLIPIPLPIWLFGNCNVDNNPVDLIWGIIVWVRTPWVNHTIECFVKGNLPGGFPINTSCKGSFNISNFGWWTDNRLNDTTTKTTMKDIITKPIIKEKDSKPTLKYPSPTKKIK